MAGGPAPPYLADLNPEQREAVETLDGPVLVLAGAGTGKTRVLTTRIAHILATGRARPGEILSVTFTNKAAREMKERVGKMVGQVVEGMPWLGTFHSIGVQDPAPACRIGRAEARFHHSRRRRSDPADEAAAGGGEYRREALARARAGLLIDSWKNRGLTPDQVPAGEAASFANGKGKKLYIAYQERLKMLNAADFGDLLLENIRLFREQPGVLRQYQQRFKYILVDEYQDTNVAQYLWLRLLGQASVHVPPRHLSATRRSRRRRAPSRARTPPPQSARPISGRHPSSPRSNVPQARPKTSAALATTISRSTAGAARRSITSCASTTIFPAPRSSGWNAITARPATSSPPPRT